MYTLTSAIMFNVQPCLIAFFVASSVFQSERAKVEDLRGTPMTVGTLEEIIDDNHAIVSSSMGPEYYVTIMSFVNQDLLEVGCSVLLHNKVNPLRRRSFSYSIHKLHFLLIFR